MASTRKQIYIPDEEIWKSIQAAAKSQGRSVSNYLVHLHKASCGKEFIEEPGEITSEVWEGLQAPHSGKARLSKEDQVPESWLSKKEKPKPFPVAPVGNLKGKVKGKANFSERKPASEMKSPLYNPVDEG